MAIAYKLIKYFRFSPKPPFPFLSCQARIFWKFGWRLNPPPAERGGEGCTLCHSLVSSFTPIGLWQPKILFAVGLMNLRIFDLKMLSVSELRMLESNFFHSIMVDGKYESLKSWCFTLIWAIFCAFLVLYWQFDCGIISKRYFGH